MSSWPGGTSSGHGVPAPAPSSGPCVPVIIFGKGSRRSVVVMGLSPVTDKPGQQEQRPQAEDDGHEALGDGPEVGDAEAAGVTGVAHVGDVVGNG